VNEQRMHEFSEKLSFSSNGVVVPTSNVPMI
jgi:hypothetical protein